MKGAWALVVGMTVGGLVIDAPEAEACGMLACDAPPPSPIPVQTPGPSMPVDQTGENILFVLDGDTVEAHIQIQYEGEAENFSWIVPVIEVPEIEVGSFRLLQNVLDATVPIYGYRNEVLCDGVSASDTSGGGGPPPSGFITMSDLGGGSGDGPEILVQDTVGAFDYTVLSSASAAEVMSWLGDHGYFQDPRAEPLLQDYADEGHVFVAFKLRGGAEVSDIHPVVIRYPGTEACIPIRLTRVAAKDDMDIRAIFLGDRRVMPTNYRHVRLNRVRLDWLSAGDNYKELVTMAVDAQGSDGRGFVTEYAGASAGVSTDNLRTQGYDADVFVTADPRGVVLELERQGLVECGPISCEYRHELIAGLLHEFLPPPDGVSEGRFYACLVCYGDRIDPVAWDGAAFAAELEARIIHPAQHATELLETWPYLTRLYTTISPHEMITDPLFGEVQGLDDVRNRHGALRSRDCCGDAMRLPGGRQIDLPEEGWPSFPESLAWAERIEEVDPNGRVQTIVNESAAIDAWLAEHNAISACFDPEDATGGTTGTTGDLLGGNDEVAPTGCACATGPGARLSSWWLLLGLLGIGRRR